MSSPTFISATSSVIPSTPDYSAWPIEYDVMLGLLSLGIVTDASDPSQLRGGAIRLTRVVEEVPAEVLRRTHRQFIADTVDTLRYFDGSGTGVQEVDEMVSLTSITILGLPPPAQPFTLQNAYLEEQENYPKTRIAIYQSSLPGYGVNYLIGFPEGRRNIAVTGKFGYGVTIPADLWNVVLDEEVARIATDQVFSGSGRVANWKIGNDSEAYDLRLPDEVTGARMRFLRACGNGPGGYQRPLSRRLRKLRPRMI